MGLINLQLEGPALWISFGLCFDRVNWKRLEHEPRTLCELLRCRFKLSHAVPTPSFSSHSSLSHWQPCDAVRLSMEKGGAKHLVLCMGPPFGAPRAVAPVDDATPGEAEEFEVQRTPETRQLQVLWSIPGHNSWSRLRFGHTIVYNCILLGYESRETIGFSEFPSWWPQAWLDPVHHSHHSKESNHEFDSHTVPMNKVKQFGKHNYKHWICTRLLRKRGTIQMLLPELFLLCYLVLQRAFYAFERICSQQWPFRHPNRRNRKWPNDAKGDRREHSAAWSSQWLLPIQSRWLQGDGFQVWNIASWGWG